MSSQPPGSPLSSTSVTGTSSTFGLAKATLGDLRGGDAEEAALIARAVLAGEEGPRRDVVLLNAAAALEVAGRVATLQDGLQVAAAAIDTGAAATTLDRWSVASTA